ncbi:alpha/beta fold hydrolase [Rhodococcus hoagii]|nr:alpha/beta fold hydrolase [Prescottella equi]
MDVIRSVLGDAKLNYLGFSYGTRIGTQYAETFPRNVRAMVLDGAPRPRAGSGRGGRAPGSGLPAGVRRVRRGVRADVELPTRHRSERRERAFPALVDPLVARPAATTDPRGLSYSDAITGVTQALYSPSLWSSLRGGLSSLAEGNGDTLLLLADLYEGRADDGTYSNINDAFNAIRCVDDPPLTDRAVAGEADMRYREAAPFLDDGRGTGNAPLDACAFWPVPNTGAPHAIDPASVEGCRRSWWCRRRRTPPPLPGGRGLAKQLDAALVTYRGAQHTASFDGVACIDDPLTRYFVDLTVPDPDLTC